MESSFQDGGGAAWGLTLLVGSANEEGPSGRKQSRGQGKCGEVARAPLLRLIEPPEAQAGSVEWSSGPEFLVAQSYPRDRALALPPSWPLGTGRWGEPSSDSLEAEPLASLAPLSQIPP